MPARLSKVVRWIERRGLSIEKPAGGSHWKVRLPDGDHFVLPAHNALRSEISDLYLKRLAKKLGTSLAQLLAELE
jgi:hypothetical protein